MDQKIRNGGQASGARVTGPPHCGIIGGRAGAKHPTGGVGVQEGGVPIHIFADKSQSTELTTEGHLS